MQLQSRLHISNAEASDLPYSFIISSLGQGDIRQQRLTQFLFSRR
jgi:hypothetical protein